MPSGHFSGFAVNSDQTTPLWERKVSFTGVRLRRGCSNTSPGRVSSKPKRQASQSQKSSSSEDEVIRREHPFERSDGVLHFWPWDECPAALSSTSTPTQGLASWWMKTLSCVIAFLTQILFSFVPSIVASLKREITCASAGWRDVHFCLVPKMHRCPPESYANTFFLSKLIQTIVAFTCPLHATRKPGVLATTPRVLALHLRWTRTGTKSPPDRASPVCIPTHYHNCIAHKSSLQSVYVRPLAEFSVYSLSFMYTGNTTFYRCATCVRCYMQ